MFLRLALGDCDGRAGFSQVLVDRPSRASVAGLLERSLAAATAEKPGRLKEGGRRTEAGAAGETNKRVLKINPGDGGLASP